MSKKLFSVYAVNIKTQERRLMAENKTERNAEAIINMAIMRRGVDEEFYVSEEQPDLERDAEQEFANRIHRDAGR